MRPEWLLDVSDETYHADRNNYLTAHSLADFRRCPYTYHLYETGKLKRPESSEYAFGTAAHKLILEGSDAFDAEYTVADGPVNDKTGKPYGRDTKKFQAWMELQTKHVITTADHQLILAMGREVRDHEAAAYLLSYGYAEGTIRFNLEDRDVQGRLDWYSDEHGLVDYKTCRDLDRFEFDCRDYGYAYQLALYWSGITELTEGEVCDVHIIAQEKTAPYRVGVWQIPDTVLDECAEKNGATIRQLNQCEDTDSWPTRYTGVRLLERY